MIVTVNGKEKKLPDNAKLSDALAGEHYVSGTLVSIHLSTEKLVRESEDFEIVTEKGSIVIHLDDSNDAEVWRSMIPRMSDLNVKWSTERIDAFGAFPTDIKPEKVEKMYRVYDCFFSLGGMDNHTTYFMIAKEDHRGAYGAGAGRIGRITRGRHILKMFEEGDRIIEVKPLVSEESTDNVIVTTDMKYALADGYRVDTHVTIKLNENSPESAEHVLILASKGYMNISDATGSYAACSDDQDVVIPEEDKQVRGKAVVTVRSDGVGLGRVFFYKDRRQLVMSHNCVGQVIGGLPIVSLAGSGDNISVVTEPPRLLTVGMTQAAASKMLEERGIKQKRTGVKDDDAIIVEQNPENTLLAIKAGEVETFAVPKDKIYKVSLDRKKSSVSVHYFEKVTGLSHKPIGSLKVFFKFEGMPMVTFEGDESRAHTLYPNDPFKKCKKGDLGVTNQSRPNAGLIGIRLEDSKEFGPTGEEGYGTNIFGKFEGDLKAMLESHDEEDLIYITEGQI